jgi:hypothetical protein
MAIVASKDRISKKDLSRYGKVTEVNLETLFGY